MHHKKWPHTHSAGCLFIYFLLDVKIGFFSLRISLCTEHTYFISCLSCHNRNFHGPIGGWGRVLCYCFLSHFMESKHGNFSLNQLFHFLWPAVKDTFIFVYAGSLASRSATPCVPCTTYMFHTSWYFTVDFTQVFSWGLEYSFGTCEHSVSSVWSLLSTVDSITVLPTIKHQNEGLFPVWAAFFKRISSHHLLLRRFLHELIL